MSKKAFNLAKLAVNGIKVPQGFVLDSSHYVEAIEPVRGALISAIQNRADVSRIFDHLEVPARTLATLQQELTLFSESSVFAVRSSGNVVSQGRHIFEDSQEVSLAGQFESFLNVPRTEL